VTIEEGTNIVVGNNRTKILEESYKILKGNRRKGKFLRSGTEEPPRELLIFFLGVRMSLLNLGDESSRLPPVLKPRRAGKAQSF